MPRSLSIYSRALSALSQQAAERERVSASQTLLIAIVVATFLDRIGFVESGKALRAGEIPNGQTQLYYDLGVNPPDLVMSWRAYRVKDLPSEAITTHFRHRAAPGVP